MVDSIMSLIQNGTQIDGNAPALIEGEQVLIHSQLLDQVKMRAMELGGNRQMRIAICASNSIEHILAYLAVLFSGNIWVPMNPANGAKINRKIINIVEPDRVFFEEDFHDQIWGARQPTVLAGDGEDSLAARSAKTNPQEYSPIERRESETAAIKFTGGTTGEPKGVIQTYGNMFEVIKCMCRFYKFDSADEYLLVPPLTHGSSHFVIPVLASGGCHRIVSSQQPKKIVDALANTSTLSFMPPTLIYKIMETVDPPDEGFKKLRHLTYSAAPMPDKRIRQAQSYFGPKLSTVYGQTEAPMILTTLDAESMQLQQYVSSVGKVSLPNFIRITNEEGFEMPSGTIGNIEAKGPIVMSGYFKNADLTRETIRNGWLTTGDLGYLDVDGYLFIVGRANDVIISGGLNIYPAEIESCLAALSGIDECCVFGIADEYWGERIEAAITVNCYFDGNTETLLCEVRKSLGSVKTPKSLHIISNLPRNAVGKIVRSDIVKLVHA